MSDPRLTSASGLRPASAFFALAGFLALSGVWVARVALGDAPERVSWEQVEEDPKPAFSVVDRNERPLALFVQRLDLVLSPNALWQAHTPRQLAERVQAVLQLDESPEQLLARMLPDAPNGVATMQHFLTPLEAERVERWLACGSPDGAGSLPAIRNMWVERRDGFLRVAFRPADLLDEPERAARDAQRYSKNPLRWARHIADGLALAIFGDAAIVPGGDELQLAEQRAWVWKQLLPSTWAVAVRGFPAERAPQLAELLAAEHVAHHQMRVERDRDRSQPTGQFEVLGEWNYIERVAARKRALKAQGVAPSLLAKKADYEALIASLSPEQIKQLDKTAWELLAQPLPISGLERACDELLARAQGEFAFDQQAGFFRFRRERAIRARESRAYYLESLESAPPPAVRTTFDVALARQVRLALDEAVERFEPAVAMAIAIDLATGDVLAVDARSPYHLGGFAPLFHEFTPGSTFKVNVMACALEHGDVRPSDVFNVGYGSYRLPGRTINEAENSRTGNLSVAECLAYSANAGLVQIGTRVPDEWMRERLIELGYARAPESGLGGERAGMVPPTPWNRVWTHASLSFGHELKVTLWQHAAGLAAILRGGEYLPLRVIDSVEQYGVRHDLPRAQARRVFTPATSAKVRDMMRLGAEIGTGRTVAAKKLAPELDCGTKTGTAQKVSTEICMHIELPHNVWHHEQGTRCSKECRASLRSKAKPHGNCYTSSMCIWGSRLGDSREVMVLVVIDEARRGGKYGSQLAGPTAMRILREALGVTQHGESLVAPLVDGFAPSEVESQRSSDAPWAEEQW